MPIGPTVSTISITVNGIPHTIPGTLTLDQLLDQLNVTSGDTAIPVASALNGQYVARHARASVVLNDGDAVTTFEPITGG